MTPTPLDAKPQGAQLKPCPFCGEAPIQPYLPTEPEFFEHSCDVLYRHEMCTDAHKQAWNRRAPDTDSAERIEELELDLHNTREAAKAAATLNEHEARRLVHERDTALRALAEARRENNELIAALNADHKKLGWALRKLKEMGATHTKHASQVREQSRLTVAKYEKNADSQPEKDANNG